MHDRRAPLGLLAIAATLGATNAGAEPGAAVDAGLLLARPAALPTGLTTGIGAGYTSDGTFAWGGRASWSTATEYTLTRTVADSETRLRLVGGLQAALGRGTVALRAAPGATLVHETRTRDQGHRAGLTGTALETSEWRVLPAVDVDVAVTLRVLGDWGMALSAGPSLHRADGTTTIGWLGELGFAWLP